MRRPFTPSQQGRGYRLPNEVRDRLAAALVPYRNREAAFTLAVFIARFWSVPGRVVGTFPIDRRALANHPELGLTEARVRGALRVLEEVGFLDRAIPPSGSKYKATEDGLHRKPILFAFGSEYAPAFIKANGRAAAARGGNSRDRRTITPSEALRSSGPLETASARRSLSQSAQNLPALNSPKSKSEADRAVIMGDLRRSGLPPSAFDPNSSIDAALARLWQGIRQSRGSGEDGAKRGS